MLQSIHRRSDYYKHHFYHDNELKKEKKMFKQLKYTFSVKSGANFSGERVWTNFKNAGICNPVKSSSASALIDISIWDDIWVYWPGSRLMTYNPSVPISGW